MSDPRVTRCVCFDVTFAQLKAHVDEHGGDLDEIRLRFGCTRGCGICLPYIKRMLETGETSFPIDLNTLP